MFEAWFRASFALVSDWFRAGLRKVGLTYVRVI